MTAYHWFLSINVRAKNNRLLIHFTKFKLLIGFFKVDLKSI